MIIKFFALTVFWLAIALAASLVVLCLSVVAADRFTSAPFPLGFTIGAAAIGLWLLSRIAKELRRVLKQMPARLDVLDNGAARKDFAAVVDLDSSGLRHETTHRERGGPNLPGRSPESTPRDEVLESSVLFDTRDYFVVDIK